MTVSRTPARIGHLFVLMVALFVTQLTACGGSDSGFALSIVRPFALTYSNSSVVYVTGQPIIDNRPSVRGGPVDSYTIQPPLPSGLRINPQTGVIRGTPASPSAATIYTVTASNLLGSTVGRVQIEVSNVVIAPDSLRYPQESAIYTTGQQIPPNIPVTTGGEITQFTVDPSLPSGLSLDPQRGVISGAPATAQAATQYTVTGANSAGNVQATISIAVQDETGVIPPPTTTPPPITTTPPPITTTPPPTLAPPATIAYEDAVYVVGQTIVPNGPTLTGGPPSLFAVSPVLPDGLTLDTTTGVISGAPTTLQGVTPYTVTASNTAGQAQTTLNLAVTRVGTWTPAGNLNTHRYAHTASLRPDTTVLIAGGLSSRVLNSAEIRSQPGVWFTAPPMTASRLFHTSTALPDGRVLVVGGIDGGANIQNSVEIFDGTAWSPAAPMTVARQGHTATLLKNGKVLVVGGYVGIIPTVTAEVYDAGTWTRVASLHRIRANHTATLLLDGRVLVTGGKGSTGALASAEVYDPGNDSWTEVVPNMSQPRTGHTASLLRDGSVLVAGGTDIPGLPTNQAELFNPGSMNWEQLPPMKTRRMSHTATTMQNGQVVVIGGAGLIFFDSLRSVEIFDPVSKQWLPAASMAAGRKAHTATLLPDGRLLVVAGLETSPDDNPVGSSELFDIDH